LPGPDRPWPAKSTSPEDRATGKTRRYRASRSETALRTRVLTEIPTRGEDEWLRWRGVADGPAVMRRTASWTVETRHPCDSRCLHQAGYDGTYRGSHGEERRGEGRAVKTGGGEGKGRGLMRGTGRPRAMSDRRVKRCLRTSFSGGTGEHVLGVELGCRTSSVSVRLPNSGQGDGAPRSEGAGTTCTFSDEAERIGTTCKTSPGTLGPGRRRGSSGTLGRSRGAGPGVGVALWGRPGRRDWPAPLWLSEIEHVSARPSLAAAARYRYTAAFVHQIYSDRSFRSRLFWHRLRLVIVARLSFQTRLDSARSAV